MCVCVSPRNSTKTFMRVCVCVCACECLTGVMLSGLSSAVDWLRRRLLVTADDRDEDDG